MTCVTSLKSEMKRYKVTNVELPVADEEVASRNAMPGGEAAPSDHAPPSPKSPGSINTGRVRHPSGSSPLKSAADNGSRDLLMLANGTAVSILGTEPDWYRVQVGTRVGYLHPRGPWSISTRWETSIIALFR